MNRVARFEKVSKGQFVRDWTDTFGGTAEGAAAVYDSIRLPRRATTGSAGYDFYSPLAFTLAPGETIKIPTGIRTWMREDYVLAVFPRSGLGFKYRLQLNNTVGIIDSDYYGSDNEGHIFIKVTNDSNEGKTLTLPCGDGFAQGIFLPFGITEDDEVTDIRNGGFGSTTK
ncbi:MAG: deoxyuridine 5'-triphosphate nucleotidohydrolase [Lachnospiraceae bacterium]|nr:deoxyuridine 5'-triphosphate nucleotidohydrolase [Lachnospiraceae bacterium]